MIAEDRIENVILYVISILDDLKEKGLVEGGFIEVTEEGKAKLQALKDAGFEATPEEIQEAMILLHAEALRLEEEENERSRSKNH